MLVVRGARVIVCGAREREMEMGDRSGSVWRVSSRRGASVKKASMLGAVADEVIRV